MDPDRLKSALYRHEGSKLYVYDDATGLPLKKGDTIRGNPSIGVGRDLASDGISALEEEDMLDNDITTVTKQLTRLDWFWHLSDRRQNALIDMAFNVGVDGLQKFVNLIGAIKRQDWTGAAQEILNSSYGRELPARSHENATMMETDQWPTDS